MEADILTARAVQSVASACIASLPTETRRVFAGLCLFPPAPNSFSESAASAVAECSAGTLQSLIDGGLVERTGTSQCAINPAIAEIGRVSQPNPLMHARFANYFARYADTHQAEPRALAAELVNILAAFEYAAGEQRITLVLGLSSFLEIRGDYTLWNRLVTEAALPPASPTAALQFHRARAAEKLGSNRIAAQHASTGLELAQRGSADEANLLALLGHVEMNMGKLVDAHDHLTRAVELSEAIVGSRTLCQALRSLAVVATRQSRYDEAQTALDRAVEQAVLYRDTAAEATLWTDVAVLRLHQDRLEDALAAAHKALEAAHQIGFAEKKAAALEALGGMLIRCNKLVQAQRALEEALTIARAIEHRWYIATILNQLGNLLLAEGNLNAARARYDEALQLRPPDSADLRAYALFGKARVSFATGETARAEELANEALHIFDNMGHHAAADARHFIATELRAT